VATTAYRRRLLSCLRYDADDVCLTLTRNAGALGAGFRSVAVTVNQCSVDRALDRFPTANRVRHPASSIAK
jgi:predicted trehalose synthase